MNEEEANQQLVEQMFPVWMNNFRINLPMIWNSYCVSDLKKQIDSPVAICVGAGPSLVAHDHLKMLAEADIEALIIACDRILIPCLKQGLVPDIVTSIDSDIEVLKFFDDKLVDKNQKYIDAVLCTTIHPKVAAKWHGPRYFVNTHVCGKLSDPTGVDMALQHISGKMAMNTSGNVGMFNFILAAYLGAKEVCLIGMDMSGHHEFYSNYSKTWIQGLSRDVGIKVYNCTEGGTLRGTEGMQEMKFSDFLATITHKKG